MITKPREPNAMLASGATIVQLVQRLGISEQSFQRCIRREVFPLIWSLLVAECDELKGVAFE